MPSTKSTPSTIGILGSEKQVVAKKAVAAASGVRHVAWRPRKEGHRQVCWIASAAGVCSVQSVRQRAPQQLVEHIRARLTSAPRLSGMPDLCERSDAVAGKACHGGHNVNVKDLKIELNDSVTRIRKLYRMSFYMLPLPLQQGMFAAAHAPS